MNFEIKFIDYKNYFLYMSNKGEFKKYHFLYKTTNLLNSKVYYGMHSTNDLNDGYLGSGR